MVVKLAFPANLTGAEFESSVNSYGGKTGFYIHGMYQMFESSVNSYGGKTDGKKTRQKRRLRVV